MRSIRLLPAALLLAPLLALADAPALPAPLEALDARVEQVRETFQVPGIAVAVVKDGEVVLERGWGVREEGTDTPVDQHTQFAIASLTKAFTAASIAMLADEGKLDLDDRVSDHLPWFRMADPYISREMRLHDLLTHRSGLALGAGDLLFWPTTTYSTREVVERLARVPVGGGFRDRYAYDNVLYAVAQLVIEQASGQPFDVFLQQRIFNPLEMGDTRFNADHLRPDDRNVAIGHASPDGGALVTMPPLTWHNASGAGGIYSSVHDMGNWMRLQLAAGVIPDGDGETRLFSAERHRAMWEITTPIPMPADAPVPALQPAQPQFSGYGHGWRITDYRGQKLVWHTGGWPGMVSRLTLVPAHNLGVVVLTNQESGAAFNAVTMYVLDAFLGAPAHDWIAAYREADAKSDDEAAADWAAHVAARDATSRPSLPLARYAGTWRDDWYGDIVLREGSRGLELQFARTAQLLGDLEHWQHDTFIVRWRDRALNADAFITFQLDPDGRPVQALMESVSPATDFSFDFHHLVLKPAGG